MIDSVIPKSGTVTKMFSSIASSEYHIILQTFPPKNCSNHLLLHFK